MEGSLVWIRLEGLCSYVGSHLLNPNSVHPNNRPNKANRNSSFTQYC